MGSWRRTPRGAQSRWEQFQDESRIYFAKGTWEEIDLKEKAKVNRLTDMINADSNVYVATIGRASGDGEANDQGPRPIPGQRLEKD